MVWNMVNAGQSLNGGGRHGVGRWMQPRSVQVVLNLHAQGTCIQDDEGLPAARDTMIL